mgnify:CR=1 FL=1|jgi:hypothetical protein
MSINEIVNNMKNDIIISNSHWLRVTKLDTFPKIIKYTLGKLPIINNCELYKSNRNRNNKMKIIMKNKKTSKLCLYILIEKHNYIENIRSENLLDNLNSIVILYNSLNKENEEKKKKILELEETFQPEDEIVI